MKKILVIEDDPSILDNIAQILELNDYHVLQASNGRIGLNLAVEKRPELIICDIMMPELDGYEVLLELRVRGLIEIPFIFLTARAERSAQRRGMEIGADDYITKPFTPEDLLSAVESRLTKFSAVAQQHDKKLDDLRRHLSHMLPHELRTPLNTIMGYTDLLKNSPEIRGLDSISEIVEYIAGAGQRLLRVCENFTLYTELQLFKSRGETPHGTVCSPETIIRSQASLKALEAQRQDDLLLNVCVVSALNIAATSLEKIVAELVENAFKFSKPGTPVQVSGRPLNGKYVLSITDSGRGMQPEQISAIGAYMQFERRLYEQQGTGLGLTLAKELAELFGGQLAIHSVSGEQTTITVSLPIL